MRRYSLTLTALVLAMLLMVGLTWAEETKTCQKSTTATAVGCQKKCASDKACARTEGLSSADAGKHCAGEKGGSSMGGCKSASGDHDAKGCGGSEGCHGSGGCRMMMAGGSGHGMMDMHRGMMGRSGRHHGRRMGSGFPRSGGPGHFIRMAEHLELTDKQIEDLKALRRNHEKSAIEMRAEIALARVDMKALLDQESIDFGKIKAKVSQIADMHKKMGLARWTLMEKSHDLLTAEQLEKAKTLRKRGSGSMMGDRRQIIKKKIIEEAEE